MLPIPSVLGWTIAALAAGLLTRTLVREWRRVNAMLDAQKAAARETIRRDAYPTLRRDPRTGIYRPE
jgi:hypothetical protein